MSAAPLVPVVIIGGAVYVLAGIAPTVVPPVGTGSTPSNSSNVVPPYDPMNLAGASTGDNSAKIDALMAAAAAKYENQMSAEAKAQAAQQLNDALGLQPPLTGNETWQQVASIAGGAVGGAVGGPLGAIAGAYLGTTLESWLGSDLATLQNWINSNLGSAAGQAVSDIEKYLGF